MVHAAGPQRLVGREKELAALRAALSRAADQAVVAVVVGEAGIGKTMLIDALATEASAHSHQVLRGECTVVLTEPIPYAPIAGALTSAGIFPTGEPVVDRTDLFVRILRQLVGTRGPALRQLLVLEDLHWADAATLELIGFLGRHLPAEHLMVLSYRSDELPTDPSLSLLLDAVTSHRRVSRLALERLGEVEIADLFEDVCSRRPTLDERKTLMARSGGNPFLASELAAAGRLDRLPASIADVLSMRIARLSERSQQTIRVAAVIGRPVGHRMLQEISGLPADQLRDSIAEVVAAGILQVRADDQRYVFRHALAQDAVIASMLPGERQHWHHRAAEVLGRSETVRLSASQAAEWAAHWRASGRDAEAFDATLIAARGSTRAFARAEAWRQYQYLMEAIRAGGGPADAGERIAIVGEAAEAARWAGASAQAVELAELAVEGLHDDAPKAAATERLGRSLWDAGDTVGAARAYATADRLAAATPPSQLHATIAASRARLAVQTGHYAEAEELAGAAAALADQVGAPAELGRALSVIGLCRVFAGDLDTGITTMFRAAAIASGSGDDEDRRRISSNLAYALLLAGRLQQACDVAVEGLQVARRHQPISATGGSLVGNTIVLLRLAGRWDEACELSDNAFAEGVTQGQALMIRLARAELDIARGDQAAARENLDAAAYLDRQRTSPSVKADIALAEAEWLLGARDHAAAAAQVRRARQVLDSVTGPREVARASALGLRIAADWSAEFRSRRNGLAGDVDPLVDVAALRAAAAAVAAANPPPEVAAFCAVAEAEWARAKGLDAVAQWRSAAERWERIGCPWENAYARMRLGEQLLTSDRRAARVELEGAGEIAAALGAATLRADINGLAARGRLRLPVGAAGPAPSGTTVAAGPGGLHALTSREREVLEELTLGLTNKQIASRLFLSPRTVDVHVGNILMKLDARTRAEAVSIVAREAQPVQAASGPDADGAPVVSPVALADPDRSAERQGPGADASGAGLPRQLSASQVRDSFFGGR